jgi:hypothetical protein
MVRSEMISFPDQGWMARPAHLPTLLSSLLPLWQEYWQQRPHSLDWAGTIALTVGDTTSFLEFGSMGLHFVDTPSFSPHNVTFSQQVFTQLIFGFRPISWALTQPGQLVDSGQAQGSGQARGLPLLIPVLNVLFPLGQAWIAGSDFF